MVQRPQQQESNLDPRSRFQCKGKMGNDDAHAKRAITTTQTATTPQPIKHTHTHTHTRSRAHTHTPPHKTTCLAELELHVVHQTDRGGGRPSQRNLLPEDHVQAGVWGHDAAAGGGVQHPHNLRETGKVFHNFVACHRQPHAHTHTHTHTAGTSRMKATPEEKSWKRMAP